MNLAADNEQVAERAFGSAMSFDRAASYLAQRGPIEGDEWTVSIMPAALPLKAFSVELFIKVLHALDHGHMVRGHDFLDLFLKLREDTKDRLRLGWLGLATAKAEEWSVLAAKSGVGPLSAELDKALADGSKAFEELRYVHETGTANTKFYLDELTPIIAREILGRRPAWAARTPRFERDGDLLSSPSSGW